jgi:hypothetical protein
MGSDSSLTPSLRWNDTNRVRLESDPGSESVFPDDSTSRSDSRRWKKRGTNRPGMETPTWGRAVEEGL